MNHLGDYDVIVIGAGHAGIEAAHAAATLGARTAVFTMSLDAIGNMPCNPSIGGTAKGTLVRELDALGGVMGLAADATYLQSRMLNKGKGPAVHALRVQTDRKRYHEYMKHALELTPGLAIHQAEVVSIETENGRVKGVVTQLNGEYSAKCVVIATGTNLGGKIFVGDAWYASGPDGMHAANALTDSLKAAGLPLRRFKTGTPARVHRRSIDFSKLECQPGDPDNELQPFSFMTDAPMHNKVECWIAYTNPETHRIILDNIQRSPLYGGMIEGVGPRYCPSIEDKVVRFAGKDRHPIFVEPCGENTEEMYLQGASSSLPEDVQNAFYRSIKGFENIEIMRPAYAIEYDCVDPTSLEATLESKVVRGLYGAGQFNGTSGYEEAAAQGLLAGLNAARIGNMPCNPSIGGTAKGTLVRELDALGGVMGLAADATYLQSRMLNKGKGPAVHALRVQTDRKRYHEYMKHALELTPGLAIHQAEVVSIETENGRVKGVVTQLNGEYSAKCVVIATGTNLGGKIFVGDAWYASGPDGMHAANALTDSLKAAGLPLRRFKTGTPARVHRRSIDFSKLECQPGDPDNELQPFSFMTDAPMHNKVECWIAYTNPETHRIILDNIQRSPLYGGMIEGVGPRYCPSIEDKVVRFAGKDRHPIFVEPCGENTEEMYLQGASSSLPEDVQNAFYRSIKGFENIEIMRPAYAIEYDCVDPTSLEATLESKVVRGLYGAGQFNGTSGYEEAAAQGLLAGLNAARNALGKEQLILPRHTSYLGTLVDDLVTKGVMDPYRMMTSRSEYRLTLRQDNADQRLTPIGREYGLVQDDRWAKYQHTQSILEAERRRLHETHLRTADLRTAMEAAGLAPAAEGGIAEELLRRPEISYPLLAGVIGWGEEITPMLAERLETEIKYAGYIARQDRMIRDVARHEKTLIPDDFEYSDLTGLTLEAREKLARIRPKNLGQAGRIPGVSPSDVAQLSIALAARGK